MYYSACPWLDDYYRADIVRPEFRLIETHYFDTQCGINGWGLAGVKSLEKILKK